MVSNAALRVDIALELGEHSEAMTVSEAPTQVETANTQMGERITASKMSALPVNGRSYTDLLALQTGVIPASSQQPNAVVMSGCTSAPPSGDLNPGNLSVSGQRETTNGFTVNGISAQEDFNMGAAIVPNLDSIQEFRVLTSNFNAEYGNFSGGQVQVVTKLGNQRTARQRVRVPAQHQARRAQLSSPSSAPSTTATSSAAPWAAPSARTKSSSSPTIRERA